MACIMSEKEDSMPRRKDGQMQRGIMAPEGLWAALDALAATNKRTATQEVLHALERHLAAPPSLMVHVPPLLPAVVVMGPEAEVPVKRGRPPKKGPA